MVQLGVLLLARESRQPADLLLCVADLAEEAAEQLGFAEERLAGHDARLLRGLGGAAGFRALAAALREAAPAFAEAAP